jgi:hypothetical protein
MNLDYGPYVNGSRHGADPVIILFKGKYFLFDTIDQPGYRSSDDLLNWTFIPFEKGTLELAATSDKKEIVAPAVVTDGKYVYYVNFGSNHVLRTAEPTSGKWDEYATMKHGYGDPDLFFDTDHKLYMLSGLSESTIVELNPENFSEIDGTKHQLTPHYKDSADFIRANSPYGLFQGRHVYNRLDWNSPRTLDTSPIIDNFTNELKPMQEGSWLTKCNGLYYLQNSSPDTACPWYSDSVWQSDSISGPYRLADYSPASMKVGGFINSTGHSCVFQDKYGNWWRVTTMWIGVSAGFERRLGLFPVGFDNHGRMFTQTTLGDYPMILPEGSRDPNKVSPLADWFLLSSGKSSSASSVLMGHEPKLAADENVRTWWSAATGNPGEWFQLDLGKPCQVNAVQINFAEQHCQNNPRTEDYMAYQLFLSEDGNTWDLVVDKSNNKTALPHDYISFDHPIFGRFLKIVNFHTAKLGKFALRDLRVFGNGDSRPPATVSIPMVKRLEDRRNATFYWQPETNADGYVIRYGVAPDALHLNLQVPGGSITNLTVSCLNRDVKYFYRIDAYNDSGITFGKVSKSAK